MPFTTRLMAQGDWSVRLRDDTPQTVLNQIATPFGLVVITPGRIGTGGSGLSDATMLAASRFTGVLLRPGPQREIGGAGLAWFLGDDEARFGLEAAVSGTRSLSSWLGQFMPSWLTAGTISGAGNVTGEFRWVSRRQAVDAICRAFGVDWRLNPNLTYDVAATGTLWSTTPTAILVRRQGPRELGPIQGVTGNVGVRYSWENYVSKVVAIGSTGRSSSGGASAYRDPSGSLLTVNRIVSVPEAQPGTETVLAGQVLAQSNSTVRTVAIETADYDVEGRGVEAGGYVYLYDPEQGLTGSSQVQYRGATLQPAVARVIASTQPVQQGMGVYVRYHNGTSASYVDLSEWVDFDAPGGQLEVGAPTMTIQTQVPTAQIEAWTTWDSYTPSTSGITLGNGTVAGKYRRVGSLLHTHGKLTGGSTSAAGAGVYTIGLPSGFSAVADGRWQMGVARGFDSSTNIEYPMTVKLGSGASSFELAYGYADPNPPNSYVLNEIPVQAGFPFTFANGDTFEWTLTCEISP